MTSQDEAAAILEDGHRALAELFGRLDDAALAAPGTIGSGGEWSAKDLAGHLGLWEGFAIEAIDAFGRGERPAVESWFAEDGAGDRVNDEDVERLREVAPAEIRARFEDLHARVLAAIAGARDWDAPYPYDEEDRTLGDRVGSLLGAEDGKFRHAFAHLADLRDYVETT